MCEIPQEFALQLGERVRSLTSGYAQVQFCDSAYHLCEDDPRHENKALSEEEQIEFGDQGRHRTSDQKAVRQNKKLMGKTAVDEDVGANVGLRLVNKVLRQKGLYVGDIIEDAEKQRTLKRNR